MPTIRHPRTQVLEAIPLAPLGSRSIELPLWDACGSLWDQRQSGLVSPYAIAPSVPADLTSVFLTDREAPGFYHFGWNCVSRW